ncbi:MAG: pilus assembly protein CpaE, partial [Pseudomonadota bacterium]
NLSILSAEAPINQPLMTDGSAFVQLEEEFRQAFEMTLIDMPRNMLINFPQLLADVNLVLLTCELTLASARDTIRILSWLKANAPHAHPMVVANKVQASVAEISKADFEASIERKIDAVIPYDIKAASNAAKLGQVFIDANRSSKATAAIKQIATRILGASEEDLEDALGGEEKKSLLGGFDFKGLLAKKDKEEAAAE